MKFHFRVSNQRIHAINSKDMNKKIYKFIKTISLVVLPVLGADGGLSSCDDFLSIKPLNDIVLENYWTEEADVYSVLNSCYAQLESSNCISRMIAWGEMRSDNMTNGASTPNDINQIFKENILETNQYTNWQSFYEVINRCNTVIHFAPSVHELDPNFSKSELNATIAEATTLRALCYFYLIRAFRDVPYVTEPSLSDDQEYQVPAMPFDAILQNLIKDVEAVAEDAYRSYGEETVENTCRITRWACYALLADLNLWKGDYENCIKYCDLVIDQKIAQYEEEYEKNPTTLTTELYGKYPLISESTGNSNYAGNTYDEIFGTGNSFESIFELNFINNQNVTNSTISSFYGSNGRTTGSIGVPSFICEEVNSGTNKYFTKTDCRFLENVTSASNKYYIMKYVNQSCSFRTSTTTGNAPTVSTTVRSNNYANWIIYRLTDIMLIRAEAEIQLAGDIEKGTELTEEQEAHYRSAFGCISAVWRRANNKRIAVSDTLVYDDYAVSRQTMEDLVMDERQRELMFEGKRWFDLVRQCRRDGNNDRMISKVIGKFQENTSAIRIKLSSDNILYWPYNREELKQNDKLQQNPAYETQNTEQNF